MAGLRIFAQTSQAIQLFFEMAGMLGLPDSIREVGTPAEPTQVGLKRQVIPVIQITSGFSRVDEQLVSRFFLFPNGQEVDLRIGRVRLVGDNSDMWGPPRQPDRWNWEREFMVFNHEDRRLEVVAPGTVIGDAFNRMPANAKLAMLQRYFYTGKTPFNFPKE